MMEGRGRRSVAGFYAISSQPITLKVAIWEKEEVNNSNCRADKCTGVGEARRNIEGNLNEIGGMASPGGIPHQHSAIPLS